MMKCPLIINIILIIFIAHQSQQYEMETITKSPYAVTKPDPEMLNAQIVDLESRRTSVILPTQARLSIGDAVRLCETFGKDEDVRSAMQGIRGFHFVPIYPVGGYDLPLFKFPCFGWVRKRCVGIPKPPFDYRCHYWTPYWVFAGSECGVGSRRKRGAGVVLEESLVVSGTEALTLCSTAGQLEKSQTFTFDAVALPTNEASELRCMNWRLSPQGTWEKEQLMKEACDQFNVERPAGYIMNEINDAVIEDLFSDVVTCGARERIIDCLFIRHNVRDSAT
ncbi:hypothetical protein Ocin01_03030 [Orchesella cincta]|uniref:Uncharacterized protein n=1 Tax=Orchesella cincta TaxID=48709 RepID=A0A1D2NEK7_ORCCI|nr:hypothetical protein Ocin01_03030 [Orchesella cincta]